MIETEGSVLVLSLFQPRRSKAKGTVRFLSIRWLTGSSTQEQAALCGYVLSSVGFPSDARTLIRELRAEAGWVEGGKGENSTAEM